ncbi:SNF2-related protein [Streptomyces sp. NPDC048290]|uniref:SNF2-related protein n=1 Tax=Streptomyces sp. NPDC048290 TaxID=3155811 RepID=UPI00341E1A5B
MTTRPTPLTTGEVLDRRARESERRQIRDGTAPALRRLKDGEFGALLSRACADGLVTGEFLAEVVRRAEADLLGTDGLRALLLGSPGAPGVVGPGAPEVVGPGAPEAVSSARWAAWASLATAGERATTILTAHAEAEGSAFVLREVAARPGMGRFGAQAGWRSQEGFAHGIAVYADRRHTARLLAAVSLVGHLSGVEPVVQESDDGEEWARVGSGGGSLAPSPEFGFRARLRQACARDAVAPVLVAEVAARAMAGVMDTDEAYLVLFEAKAPQWAPARRAVMESVAAGSAGTASALLQSHAAAGSRPLPVFEDTVIPGAGPDEMRYRACLAYDSGSGLLRADSGPRRSKKVARRTAATAVLAQLAGMTSSGAADAPPTAPGRRNPVSALDELTQMGLVSDLVLDVPPTLTGRQPLFTCRASCRAGGRDLAATGSGLSTGAAQEDAARALLGLVVAESQEPPAGPVRAVPATKPLAPGRSPLGAFNSLRQTGTVTDVETGYASTGPAHRPMFRCTLSCRFRGRPVRARGRAASKQASLTEAARVLLAVLSLVPADPDRHVREAEPRSIRPRQQTGTSPDQSMQSGQPDQSLQPLQSAQPDQSLQPLQSTQPDQPLQSAQSGHPIPPVQSTHPIPPTSAPDLLAATLRAGAALTADLSDGSPRMLVFHLAGAPPLPDGPPLPLRSGSADLLLPGDGVAVRAESVMVWEVPLRLLAGVLAGLDGDGLHASVEIWRAVIRLGVEAVAQQRVYPGADPLGRDAWRLGPLGPDQRAAADTLARGMPPYAHCVPAARGPYRLWAPDVVVGRVLDALADAVVRSPGAPYVLGAAPYTAPLPRAQGPALEMWTDRVAALADAGPSPGLVLTIKPPPANTPADSEPELLWAVLRIRTHSPGGEARVVDAASYLPGNGAHPALLERVRRRLRAAARLWPPMRRLLEQSHPSRFTVRAAEAALLLGEMGRDLARTGIEISWPDQWARSLGVRAVIGTRSVRAESAFFALDSVLDHRWQLTVDGDALTDAEMDALAAAGGSLIPLRDRWLLVTPTAVRRAADRHIGTLPAAEALTAVLTGSISVGAEVVACEPADALAELVDFLCAGSHQPVPQPAALTTTLRDYQLRGLAWLANLTRLGFGACLADDMGTGKTVTALALHLHRGEHPRHAGPTLVVCPATMVTAWQREAARFAPDTPTRRYHGEGRGLSGLTAAEIVITTYGTLRLDADILAAQPFGLVIADEAQYAKNPRSHTARQLRRLNTKARVALTGTPVENGVMDAWAVLDWANPGLLGTRRAFGERYARPVEQDPQGDDARRLARLLSPFLLRRLKTDPHILKELPEKITTRRIVSLTREQVGLYEAVARDTMERIRVARTGERRALVLTLLTQLRQICNTPAHYLRETPDQDGYDPAAHRRRSGKLTAVDDLLAQITARDESVLLFTGYAAMGRLLETHLRAQGLTPLFLHGQIPAGQARQDLVDAFQSGRAPVMILTVKAGGTGLTLTRASHVVMVDRPWNPAVENQAIDRAHRIGQTRTLNVHLLQTELTVEDRIDALLARKRALADAVLLGGETALADLSDGEIAELIALGGS